MSSFFTVPGSQKKRKRATAPDAPKKRIVPSAKPSGRGPSKPAPAAKKRIERDESISGSDSDDYEGDDGLPDRSLSENGSDGSDNEGETVAERRLRLAERYLANVRKEVEVDDEYGFDAEEIDRDIIAERLQEDVAESKGKVYRRLTEELDFKKATHTLFRWNAETVTSVAICAPHAYTTSKDGLLVKWKLQDLPQNQYPQTTKKKPKKPPAPPRRRPERIVSTKADSRKAQDKTFQGHTGPILTVAASQDGKFVVTGGADRRLVVHDASTLRPIRAFTQHRDSVTGLAFRRGTNQLFSCSKDRTVKVWSLDELAYVETLFGHQDDCVDIDALAQERCISVAARDRTARLWKVVDETQLVFRGGLSERKPLLPSTAPGAAAVHPYSLAHEGSMDRVAMLDDELFVTGSDNGALALWGIHKKKPLHIIPRAHGIEPPLRPDQASADVSPDPSVIPPPQPRWITALRTLPYSDVVLSGSWDGCVRVWRLSSDKRKLEAVGVLGRGGAPGPDPAEATTNGTTDQEAPPPTNINNSSSNNGFAIRGIVNDISVAERGDRGKDGLCVVVAVGREHRLGRWTVFKGGRNGAIVFEVPRLARATETNGAVHEEPEAGGEEKS
ncbi:WD domain, G-beta repeat-containing protein [Phialemonium atrogriseum]|uniref:WD domain, G-beta repeat-containing protein n=1 Tax=Phialemonium atrogriseum TaxID=1093897 RepID=A0AAJ0C5H5_9PEZI|nr:WD domain, G-beta repeat-containing protein [Phialemonium atrogriseum]KAK1770335.1 WD domain, G-beta repeat-containing protein [Phialemonium atrogriseum]